MDISILYLQYFHSDYEISANIRSRNLKQPQVFDFVHSQAKEIVKPKRLKRPEAIKPFHLFLSGSGGVGKSHLIKTVYQSVSKLLYITVDQRKSHEFLF